LALLCVALPARAAQAPFTYDAKEDHRFGSTRGTLTVGDEGVAFAAPNGKDGRRWTFDAIQQIRLAPRQIEITTYEDRGRLSTGGGRVYRYAVTGAAVDAALADFLLARVHVPVVSAVLPSAAKDAEISVPAHHERRRGGADGTLVATPAGVAFVTSRAGEARFWRYADLSAVLAIDRYRLQLSAYEGSPGETRPYVFSLKAPLDTRAYDLLWQRINRPAPRAGEQQKTPATAAPPVALR
jgi:hypothetical protein